MMNFKATNDKEIMSVSNDVWRMVISFENGGLANNSPLVIDMKDCKNEISSRIVLRTIINLEVQMKDKLSEGGRVVKVIIRDNDMRSFKLPETIDPETIKSYVRENKIYQSFARI